MNQPRTIPVEEEESHPHHGIVEEPHHQKKKSHIPRQPSKEVIETIVLDPFGCVAPTPLLPKPDRIRLISFEDSQELSKKLGGFMLARMRSKDKEMGQETTLTSEDLASGHEEEPTRPQQHEEIKHCFVDLDMAHDRWPACLDGSSTFSLSSNSSTSFTTWATSNVSSSNDALLLPGKTGRSVSVLPYPTQFNDGVIGETYDVQRNVELMNKKKGKGHDPLTLYSTTTTASSNSSSNNNSVKQRCARPINRNDVVRTRQWGKRICIPSHLLRPPLIRRQSSTE